MNQFFTEKDREEALIASGTGMWRLESDPKQKEETRFYGDTYMNYLIGVQDELNPAERFKVFMSRVHPDDMKLFMEYYMTLKEKNKAEIVYRYIHPDLGIIYVRCGGTKVQSTDDINIYRGFHQNVTQTIRVELETRSKLTEESELFKLVAYKIMEHNTNSLAKINCETGEFRWFNYDGSVEEDHPGYDEMFQRLSVLVPEEYREAYLDNSKLSFVMDSLKKNKTYSFSTIIRKPEESELRRVTYWYYTIENDPKHILSIFGDTTEDYQKEKHLAEALIIAEQASRAKTLFLNNMSHDIRTPMNAILGFLNLAQKNIENKDKCLEYLGKIQTSSEHLLSLINDVLDMSRIESGKMSLHEDNCLVRELVENIGVMINADAVSKNIRLDIDASKITNDVVICDHLRLNQVLLNCVSNSVKFTPKGGWVRICAYEETEKSKMSGYSEYVFIVEDSGIGMSKEYLEKLYEPFSREENSVHQIQGTGLGMSICKSILEMMKGTIEVESEVGVGTKMTIRIPLRNGSQFISQEKCESNNGQFNISGKRILLAEDNEINREIAVELLSDEGAIVETVENGKEAYDKILSTPEDYYNAVLMDIQMPIMNGYEATKAIRAIERKDIAGLIIIAMTANAFEEDKREAFAAGMNGHISKPVDVSVLFKTLSDLAH